MFLSLHSFGVLATLPKPIQQRPAARRDIEEDGLVNVNFVK
jgi:hypothetical protein